MGAPYPPEDVARYTLYPARSDSLLGLQDSVTVPVVGCVAAAIVSATGTVCGVLVAPDADTVMTPL